MATDAKAKSQETGGGYSGGRWLWSNGKQSGGSHFLSLNFQGIEGVEAVVSPNFPLWRIAQGLLGADRPGGGLGLAGWYDWGRDRQTRAGATAVGLLFLVLASLSVSMNRLDVEAVDEVLGTLTSHSLP